MKTNPDNDLALHAIELKKAALQLKVLNHPLRLDFLQFIHERQKVIVTDIHKKFRIEQSVASQYLALLRSAKLVITDRQGRFIYYSVNYDQLKHWHDLFGMLGLSEI